jgi:hypothetical protein
VLVHWQIISIGRYFSSGASQSLLSPYGTCKETLVYGLMGNPHTGPSHKVTATMMVWKMGLGNSLGNSLIPVKRLFCGPSFWISKRIGSRTPNAYQLSMTGNGHIFSFLCVNSDVSKSPHVLYEALSPGAPSRNQCEEQE